MANNTNHDSIRKKILYIDMDNILVNFQSGIDQLDLITKIKYMDRYDEVPGIFAKILTLKNVVESFKELGEHFDKYIYQLLPDKIQLLDLIC